jgi:hypothetical protein
MLACNDFDVSLFANRSSSGVRRIWHSDELRSALYPSSNVPNEETAQAISALHARLVALILLLEALPFFAFREGSMGSIFSCSTKNRKEM